MSYKLQTKLGNNTIMVEADNVKDLIKEVSFFNELPCNCGNCKSANLGFRHRLVQQNDFYEIICRDCGYTFKLGQHKQPLNTLFPKYTDGWQAPFVGGNNNND